MSDGEVGSSPERTESAKVDFFISYNSADRQWAEWIAWTLEAEGFHTVNMAWDFGPARTS